MEQEKNVWKERCASLLVVPEGEVDDTRFERCFDLFRPMCLTETQLIQLQNCEFFEVVKKGLVHDDERVRSVVIRLIGCLGSHKEGLKFIHQYLPFEFQKILSQAQEGVKMDPSPLIRDSLMKMLLLICRGKCASGTLESAFRQNFQIEKIIELINDSSAFVQKSAAVTLVAIVEFMYQDPTTHQKYLQIVVSSLQQLLLFDGKQSHDFPICSLDFLTECCKSSLLCKFLVESSLSLNVVPLLLCSNKLVRYRAIETFAAICASPAQASLLTVKEKELLSQIAEELVIAQKYQIWLCSVWTEFSASLEKTLQCIELLCAFEFKTIEARAIYCDWIHSLIQLVTLLVIPSKVVSNSGKAPFVTVHDSLIDQLNKNKTQFLTISFQVLLDTESRYSNGKHEVFTLALNVMSTHPQNPRVRKLLAETIIKFSAFAHGNDVWFQDVIFRLLTFFGEEKDRIVVEALFKALSPLTFRYFSSIWQVSAYATSITEILTSFLGNSSWELRDTVLEYLIAGVNCAPFIEWLCEQPLLLGKLFEVFNDNEPFVRVMAIEFFKGLSTKESVWKRIEKMKINFSSRLKSFVLDEDPLPRRSVLELMVIWSSIPWCCDHVTQISSDTMKKMMADDEDWEVKLRVLRLLKAVFDSKFLGSGLFFQLQADIIFKDALSSYDRLVRLEAANILIEIQTRLPSSTEQEKQFLSQLQQLNLEKVSKEASFEELYPEVEDYDLVTEVEIRDCFD